MAKGSITVTIKLSNPKTLRALAFAIKEAESLLEDFPYREEPEQIAKALKYVVRNIKVCS